MCVNKSRIFNPYIKRFVWVDCGKCPACQQKAANRRANRIRANSEPGIMSLFLHLTYLNECCPYIRREDIRPDVKQIPVYRDYDRRWSRVRSKKTGTRKYLLTYHRLKDPIDVYDLEDEHGVHEWQDLENPLERLRDLTPTYRRRITTLSTDGKIGIIYYKDVQNFIKKLKIHFQRKYNINLNDINFSYYITSEYGTKKESYRPHFHLLLFFPRDLEVLFREASLSCWTYAFQSITNRKLQPAIAAAKYTASYVNKPAGFPPLLSSHSFRQKYSYSEGFGMALRDFQFSEVLEKIKRGDLRYNRTVVIDGSPVKCAVPVPAYVINRYFPKFKGYSRTPDDSICWLFRPFNSHRRCTYRDIKARLKCLSDQYHLNYDNDDLHRTAVSLENHMIRSGLECQDYARTFCSAWRVYYSSLYRSLMEFKSIYQQLECYDNIVDFFSGDVGSLSLDDMMFDINPDYEYEVNPNNFKENVAQTEFLTEQHAKYIKMRDVNRSYEVLNYAEF